MIAMLCTLMTLGQAGPDVEPQPLADGVEDTGINLLLDQSHQMSFHWHWNVQSALRGAGHRVSCNQASLHHVLAPGTPLRVRDQQVHAFGGNPHRPMVMLPAPEYHVVLTIQSGRYQPYLPEERDALRGFVEEGGGLILIGRHVEGGYPLGELAAELGAEFASDKVEVANRTGEPIPGLPDDAFDDPQTVATVTQEWTVLVGDDAEKALLARRQQGQGTVFVIHDSLCSTRNDEGRTVPRTELLSWLISEAAAGKPRTTDDERRVPWEHGGIGGVYYPENEVAIEGVRLLYADNQLPHIKELGEGGFEDVRTELQKLLPTPPNPGGDMYIVLSAGAGGGWAENVFRPKVAGVISDDTDGIKSILAHELAHTMNGPEAYDGTPGCGLPGWWSEAHAGWFQRKVCHNLGIGHDLFNYGSLMQKDPLFDAVDFANLQDGQTGLAWRKAWLIWHLLDGRYGEDWYPKWLAHIHTKYEDDPAHRLTMDEYIMTISEAVGEDVAPLWELLGTTVTERTDLPPIAPK